MAQGKPQRISIGFIGGAVIAARVTVDQLDLFSKALDTNVGWHDLICEDATMKINRAQVCFVRVDSDDPRVGFGA